MNCSTPGLLVHHQLPKLTQTHIHRVGDAIQPSHPLSSPSPPAPKIPPSIRVFSSESTLPMRWPKYWNFSLSISPSNEHPGLISFRMDWLNLLAVQGTLKSLLQHHRSILDNNNEWMSRWIWKVSIGGKCPSLGWGGKQGKQSKRSYLLDHGECLFPSQRAKAQTEWYPTNSLKSNSSGVIQISKPSKASK